MSVASGANLVSDSVDASLAELDRRSNHLGQDPSEELVIGPFSVLHFPVESGVSSQPDQSCAVDENGQSHALDLDPAVVEMPSETTVTAQMPIVDPLLSLPESLEYMDGFLHWSDILGFEFGQSDFSAWPTSSTIDPLQRGLEDGNLLLLPTGLDGDGLGSDIVAGDDTYEQSVHKNPQHLAWSSPPEETVANAPASSPDVLADAPFLLKHLQEKVIALMVAMPLGRKSPWTMLNMPASVVTLGGLTFLSSQDITHARLANLYGLLACSSLHLSLKLQNDTDRSIDHWKKVTKRAFEQAKKHMRLSLENETRMPQKAKYKDQMMALCALTEFAVS